jgi:hypothetical protein
MGKQSKQTRQQTNSTMRKIKGENINLSYLKPKLDLAD